MLGVAARIMYIAFAAAAGCIIKYMYANIFAGDTPGRLRQHLPAQEGKAGMANGRRRRRGDCDEKHMLAAVLITCGRQKPKREELLQHR